MKRMLIASALAMLAAVAVAQTRTNANSSGVAVVSGGQTFSQQLQNMNLSCPSGQVLQGITAQGSAICVAQATGGGGGSSPCASSATALLKAYAGFSKSCTAGVSPIGATTISFSVNASGSTATGNYSNYGTGSTSISFTATVPWSGSYSYGSGTLTSNGSSSAQSGVSASISDAGTMMVFDPNAGHQVPQPYSTSCTATLPPYGDQMQNQYPAVYTRCSPGVAYFYAQAGKTISVSSSDGTGVAQCTGYAMVSNDGATLSTRAISSHAYYPWLNHDTGWVSSTGTSGSAGGGSCTATASMSGVGVSGTFGGACVGDNCGSSYTVPAASAAWP